jgi:hypothetical protein
MIPPAQVDRSENDMNEEQFNLDLRKFLKRFGITAQREIEKAIRDAMTEGTLSGDETLQARAYLTIEGVSLDLTIEDELRLGDKVA